MSDPRRDIRSDLEPDAPDELAELGERLVRERPRPRDEFVGALRRRLTGAQRERENEDDEAAS